jgi:hypothetical protein
MAVSFFSVFKNSESLLGRSERLLRLHFKFKRLLHILVRGLSKNLRREALGGHQFLDHGDMFWGLFSRLLSLGLLIYVCH